VPARCQHAGPQVVWVSRAGQPRDVAAGREGAGVSADDLASDCCVARVSRV